MEREQSEGSDRYSHTSITSEYDVFLSFRGPDARHGIVDHLYECMTGAGLRVFKDDEEIRRGEIIGGELKRAIDGSRVYAVVFSRNYASSAWCLRELDMMVDLCRGSNIGKKIILPIFYKVDPEDVKMRTKLYRKALDKHKSRHGHDVVRKWVEALKTVGGISGWDCKAIQGEGKFVRLIVQNIVVKLRIKDRSLPDHLTGIDDRVSEMLNLLDCDSSGVRVVVLHGMGGIGKTTLASVVFNKLLSLFEESSFISNVRESATAPGGIAKLQNKLSGDILGGHYARSCNFDDGFGEMIQRIQGKRVLLVLDDVDAHSQLEKLLMKNPEDKLGTGSRVIVTTRDKSVCNRFVRLGSELLHFYEMEKMADNYALQLFSRHAFGTDEPPENYFCLSKQVVKTTGNLPLALEVIGGHLCCQSKESWKYELEKLKNVPQEDVFKILKVSYDGLDWRVKEIFLDIVCFPKAMCPRYENSLFKDRDRQRYVGYLWEARDLYPKSGVKVLINKSFIKIDSNGEFWIHDQLRDMGREIIRSEGDGRPERRTRLWDPEDALKIVLQKKVSKEIIAMTLGNYGEALKLSDENFGGIANLLFLDLNHTELIGELENLRESLMWLSWLGYSETLNSNFFKMRSLVVLIIIGIEGEWTGDEKLMMPHLRVMEFRRSDMTTSPDLSCCLKLEIMIFLDCLKLKEIHHSVGKLESLTYMFISRCESLRSLPKELCSARALQELTVSRCKIEEVPESIGRLESLRSLNLSHNKIRRLPTSICDLTNLLELNLRRNPLDEGIPEEIGRLSALEELELSCNSIRFLPATFSQLTSLKSLYLIGCCMLDELRELPTSLTNFAYSWHTEGLWEVVKIDFLGGRSKREIRFSGAFELGFLSRLKTLGWSFPNMAPLETHVELTDFTLTEMEVGWLDSLPSLMGLSINDSHSLPQVNSLLRVSNIGRLRGLRSLKFEWCRALVEIPGLEQLELLEELTFRQCHSICRIQDLLGLKRLKKVDIWTCSSLLCVPRLIDECHLRIDCCLKLGSDSPHGGFPLLELPRPIYKIPRFAHDGGFRRRLTRTHGTWKKVGRCSSLRLFINSADSELFSLISFCDKLRSFEGSYSEYEGESSKIQLEDDSGEGGGGKRRRLV